MPESYASARIYMLRERLHRCDPNLNARKAENSASPRRTLSFVLACNAHTCSVFPLKRSRKQRRTTARKDAAPTYTSAASHRVICIVADSIPISRALQTTVKKTRVSRRTARWKHSQLRLSAPDDTWPPADLRNKVTEPIDSTIQSAGEKAAAHCSRIVFYAASSAIAATLYVSYTK